MRYVVSYDLSKQGQDYSRLIDRLKDGYKAIPVLKTQWLTMDTTLGAVQIRDDLRRYIDTNDSLLVNSLEGVLVNRPEGLLVSSRDAFDWAGYNLLSTL